MYLTLFAEILLGLLAVWGLYVLLRSIFCSVDAEVALKISAETTAEEVPLLLERAKDACFFKNQRVIVLLTAEQKGNAALLDALRAQNVVVYFIENQ